MSCHLIKYIYICDPFVRKIPWRRDRLPTPVFLGLLCSSAGKESTCNVGDLGSIPGLGRSPGEGKRYPLQYSGLKNSMNYIVHGVAKSRTQGSDFQFHFLSLYIYIYTHTHTHTHTHTYRVRVWVPDQRGRAVIPLKLFPTRR